MKVNIYLANSRSLINKVDILKAELITFNIHFHFIIITETWANDAYKDSFFEINNYVCFRNDRIGKRGGVAMMYCENICKPVRIKIKTLLRWCNSIICKCWNNLFMVCFYRPPSANKESLDESIKKIHDVLIEMLMLRNVNDRIIIAGDLNLPDVNWNDAYNNKPIYLDLISIIHTLKLR